MPSGAVQGGKLTSADRQEPVAFNSGMVLDGFVSLLECRPDVAIAEAANSLSSIATRLTRMSPLSAKTAWPWSLRVDWNQSSRSTFLGASVLMPSITATSRWPSPL